MAEQGVASAVWHLLLGVAQTAGEHTRSIPGPVGGKRQWALFLTDGQAGWSSRWDRQADKTEASLWQH